MFDDAVAAFWEKLPRSDRPIDVIELTVGNGKESWTFDSFDEFYAAHREVHSGAKLNVFGLSDKRQLVVLEHWGTTFVSVKAPDRETVVYISAVFERKAEASKLPVELAPKPRVFIGHGRSQQWRDLKDHLHEQHGYEVVAYETGARAGHTIRDILEDMIEEASFALLVMTAEDETAEGDLRARQNVVHETGLFQGKLGFARAVVLVEDGTSDYSNLQGIQQIRYSAGNMRETFGDVLATLRREFESS